MGNMFSRINELFPARVGDWNAIRDRWDSVLKFVRFDYTAKHITEISDIVFHCMYHALGVPCDHQHELKRGHLCEEIIQVPKELILFVSTLDATNDEVHTMEQDVTLIKSVLQRYTAHKVKSTHQSKQIELEAAIKEDDATKILLVMDHKKKVLPQRYREGQQEFFGKNGMSLLGVAKVYLGNTHFSDYVINGYSI